MLFDINRIAERVLKKCVLCVFLTFRCNKTPHEPAFTVLPMSLSSVCFLCRWSVWKVPGVGWGRPVHIRYIILHAPAPQDPPTEAGSQRYNLPIRLSFTFVIYQWVTQRMPFGVRQTKSAKLSLWQASTHCHRARTGHVTHIGPLFGHHSLTPAASLAGSYASWIFSANFVDE